MDDAYPMRINKYLALRGFSTRRGADALVEKGRVRINGKVAILGDKVKEDDVVEVTGKQRQSYVYAAYHKPRGVMTHSAGEDQEDIDMLIDEEPELRGVFPIGRLDRDSSGLIILTNDGRVTDRLLNPKFEHEKEYVVRTKEPLRSSFKEYMEKGVDIEGYMTKPSYIRILGKSTFAITLTEGKKHQIRRMVVAMHNEVKSLERIRVMNVALGKLPEGMWRPIEGAELKTLLTSLGL